MNTEELSEELYNTLGELLNSKQSTEIVNSLRGEYGVLPQRRYARHLTWCRDVWRIY